MICSRCVVDDIAPNTNLVLNEEGICNNCLAFDQHAKPWLEKLQTEKDAEFATIINKIKQAGKGNKYDCILGLSGGVDSSYMAYLAKTNDLRPLVVHFDNGWNSELAIQNIHHIVNKLHYELFTYVIDWEEFRDIQLAYLKASVVDIEVPTDQFIYAVLCELAHQFDIKYILDGNNLATEFPGGKWKWSYNKLDLQNLENIHRKFGTRKLNKYPKLGYLQRLYYQKIAGIESVYPLNYVPYVKNDIKQFLKKELDWVDYGGKHYESVFTRFYQGYILPVKWKIDKRKIHFSNLIWSGQMTREEALRELEKPTYPLNEQEDDKIYVIKKFGITETEFENIMNLPAVDHEFYGTEKEYIKKNTLKFKLFFHPYSLKLWSILKKIHIHKFIARLTIGIK
jgi:N-acetyl sugar amidotransferase